MLSARSSGSSARAQKLRDEAEVSRLALSNFGSMTQRSVLSDKGSASLEKKPKRQVLSRFCRIERESAKTEVMNAAAGIYSLLYAPKGHTNNLHAAGWAISRARSLAWSFVFAVAGVISAVCENEVLWANNRVPSMTSFWLKVVCVILSVAALYFTRNYYRAVIAQERLRGLPLHNGHVSVVNLQATGLFWQAFFDVLCLLPMPIPFLNFEFEFWNDSVNSAAVYQLVPEILRRMPVGCGHRYGAGLRQHFAPRDGRVLYLQVPHHHQPYDGADALVHTDRLFCLLPDALRATHVVQSIGAFEATRVCQLRVVLCHHHDDCWLR